MCLHWKPLNTKHLGLAVSLEQYFLLRKLIKKQLKWQGEERVHLTHHRVTLSPQKRKGPRLGCWAWLEFQPACEMRRVCVSVSQTHGQCIPSISLDIQHVLFLLSLSPFFLQFQKNHPKPAASLHVPWPERQKAQGFHQSGIKSTEVLTWRSTTGRGIPTGRKRRSSSPGQKRCFCSSEPSLVISGCLKSMEVQFCNHWLREALQRLRSTPWQ